MPNKKYVTEKEGKRLSKLDTFCPTYGHSYPMNMVLYKGEIGMIDGIRIIVKPNGKKNG